MNVQRQLQANRQLTIALPKQEKLAGPIAGILERAGFEVTKQDDTGNLIDIDRRLPDLKVEFVRAADALLLLEQGVADLAVIGSDVVAENAGGDEPRYKRPDMVCDFGIAACRFSIAVPAAEVDKYKTPEDLNGLKIATSYPNILGEWLAKNGVIPSGVLLREGGVESSIRQGLADVAADLVDTGGTLRRNNLKERFEIMSTSARLYARPGLRADENASLVVQQLLRRLQSQGELDENGVQGRPQSTVPLSLGCSGR